MVQGLIAKATSDIARGEYRNALTFLDEAIESLATAGPMACATAAGLRQLALCYAQRTACHREMGNPVAAIGDIGRAMAVLQASNGGATSPLTHSHAEQASTKGPVTIGGLLMARAVLLEQTEQHDLSLADFKTALLIDASNTVASAAVCRLRAALKSRCSASGSTCKDGSGWKSVPRPGMRAFENRGKAGAAF